MKNPAPLLLVFALACVSSAHAQIAGERMLPQPVEPGRVAPWRPASPPAMDPPETGLVREAPTGPTLADWYGAQGRPAVALFFDRRLERLPPGWNGTSRVRFAYEASAGTSQFRDQLTVGVERRTPVASVRSRAPVVVLIEGALLRELQSSRLRMVDPTVAERGLAARDSGGDTEFNSLRNAAGYVLEVEMVPVGDTVSMIGNLKNLRTSELVATVRQPVEHDLRDPADVDTLARAFVRLLLATPSR